MHCELQRAITKRNAEMAELADAQASGACGSNIVRVQVPFSALSFPSDRKAFFIVKTKRFQHTVI